MWARYSPLLGIDKQRFDNYYDGKEKAIGIEMYKIRRISPIHLKILRNFTPHFQPPQVYRYISNIEICELITNSECCYRENANAQNTLL
jgi:predicted transcriptional regulator